MKTRLKLMLAAVSLALTAPFVHAATYTWTGAGFFGATNYLWSDPNNWQGLAAPAPGESNVALVFPNTTAPRNTTNDIVGLSVASIQFQGANYIVAGKPSTNALTLASGALGGFSIIATGTNCQIAGSCPLVLGSVGGITVPASNTLVIAARVSGTGGFTKFSAGTLRLSPATANTFAGTVNVFDGTLDLRGGFLLITNFIPAVAVPGPLVIGGTNDALTPVCDVNQPHQIADNSTVTVNKNGQLILSSVDETIGSLVFTGGQVNSYSGTLTLSSNVTAALPPLTSTAGRIYGHLNLAAGAHTFDVQTNNAFLRVYADISGATGGLDKAGPGILELRAANSHGGAVNVLSGILHALDPLALGTTNGSTTVASNALLLLTSDGNPVFTNESLTLLDGAKLMTESNTTWNGNLTLAGNASIYSEGSNTVFTINGTLTGGGGFTKSGTGKLILDGTDDNTYAGVTVMREGTLTLQKGTLGSPRVAIPGQLKFFHLLGDDPRLVHSLRSETIASGDLFMDGGGKLLLGPLVTQTANALVLNGGEIDTGASGLLQIACDAAGANNFDDQATLRGRIDLGDAPRTFALGAGSYLNVPGSLTGTTNATLNLVSGGLIRLQGSNSHGGLTVVRGGVVFVEHPHALGATGLGTVVSNLAGLVLSASITNESLHLFGDGPNISYGALSGSSSGTNTWRGPVVFEADTELKVGAPGALILNGPVSGPGGFTKLGDGELILAGVNGDNTYAGPTTVLDGGMLTLAKTSGLLTSVAIPNDLQTGSAFDNSPSGIVRVLGSGQFKTNGVITVYGHDSEVRFEGGTNSIGNLIGSGSGGILWFGSNALLRTGFRDENGGYFRSVSGGDPANPTNVCLEKFGWGVFAIGATNTLHAAIAIQTGNLVCDVMPATKFIVRDGGSLLSTGNVGPVHMDGGIFRPGSSGGLTRIPLLTTTPGLTNAGTLRLGQNNLEVDAAPNLSNLRLDMFIPVNPDPALGSQFLVLVNRSANPTLGTLRLAATGTNLVEGAKFYEDTRRWSITYAGGNGNDVRITRIADPSAAEVLSMAPAFGGLFMVVKGEQNTEYRVETTTNLTSPAVWTNLGTIYADDDGVTSYLDSAITAEPKRFYRFVAP